MYIYIFLIILSSLIFDFLARETFIAVGYSRCYGHGKTWKRAHRHYKSNWNFWQRLLWIPVFKEPYESDFKILAVTGLIQYILMPITYVCFVVGYNHFYESKIWLYVFIAFWIFVLLRFVYEDHIGRTFSRKNKKG